MHVELIFRSSKDRSKELALKIVSTSSDTSLKWMRLLADALNNGAKINKKKLWYSFPYTDRNLSVLCNEINSDIETINAFMALSGSAESINERLYPDTVFSNGNLNTELVALMNRHFESHRTKAESRPETPSHVIKAIHRLDDLIKEIEDVIHSERIRRDRPKTVASINRVSFYRCEKKPLDHVDLQHFTLDQTFGDVFMHFCHHGRTHWDAFQSNEVITSQSTITGLRYMSGEFSLVWGPTLNDSVDFHRNKKTEYKKWLERNGWDFNDKTIGHGRLLVGRLELSAFSDCLVSDELDIEKAQIKLSEYQDLHRIKVLNDQKVLGDLTFDYTWRDEIEDGDEFGAGFDLRTNYEKHVDTVAQLNSNKSMCMLPWIHQHILVNGNMYPCCHWNDNQVLGNISETPVEEIWNSPILRNLRLQMKSGQQNSNCQHCYELEEGHLVSPRIVMNEKYAHKAELIESMDENGFVPYSAISYIDIRLSNVCNLKCRGCDSFSSSSWYDDQVKLTGSAPDHDRIMNAVLKNPASWKKIKENIHNLEEIYFAGGEPLLISENVELLRYLIANDKTEIFLRFNTNLTNLIFRGESFIDYWKKFKNVQISVSIDDIQHRAEYFRHGTKWQKVVENIQLVQLECPHVKIFITCTVSALNIYYLPEVISWAIQNRVIKDFIHFNLNILRNPSYLNIKSLPAKLKNTVSERLINFANEITSEAEAAGAMQMATDLRSLAKMLDLKTSEHDYVKLQKSILEVDKIRGESFKSTYPEIAADLLI